MPACIIIFQTVSHFVHHTAMGAAAFAGHGCGGLIEPQKPNFMPCNAKDCHSAAPEEGDTAAALAAPIVADPEEAPTVSDDVQTSHGPKSSTVQRAEQPSSSAASDSSNLSPEIREPGEGAAEEVENDEILAKSGGQRPEAILSRGGLTFSGGYSSVEGPNVEVKITRRNFGRLNREIRSSLRYSKVQTLVEFGYVDGNFMGSNLVFAPTLFGARQSTNGFGGGRQATPFRQSARGINLHLGHKLADSLSATANYRLSADSFSLHGKDSICENSIFGSPICSALGHHTSSVLSIALTWDKSDSATAPTRGFKMRLTQDFAGLGGSTRYARTRFGGEAFVSLGGEWKLSIGAEAGFMAPINRGKIPLFDKFYIGGTSMRGFDLRGIGPKVRPSAAGPGQNVAIGGRAYYAVRTELAIPVGGFLSDRGLRPSVFVDTGSVFGARQTRLMPNETLIGNSAKPRVTVGMGLSFVTPAGCLRLDIARPIVKQSGDRSRMLSISFGTTV